jgi:hypothetical protein
MIGSFGFEVRAGVLELGNAWSNFARKIAHVDFETLTSRC